MYKGIAFNAGIIIAVMVTINGMLGESTGTYFSNLVYQLTGLLIILLIAIFSKRDKIILKSIPIIFFLPGLLSVVAVVLNNICFSNLGVTLTLALSLLGQLIMSNLVDHFGLFNMPEIKFKKEKLIGFSIISLGIIFMIIL